MSKLVIRISLCIFSIINYNSSLAQNAKRIMVFANKNDFLIPLIKTDLEGLVDSKSGEKIFSKAINFNLITVNTQSDFLMRKVLSDNFQKKDFKSDTTTSNLILLDSIFSEIIKYDQYLMVNENVLLDKIEFQLTLFNIQKNESVTTQSEDKFPFKDIFKPIAENNFFVDINSVDYLNVLKNGIKKLFPASNFPTQFKISLNGNINNLGKNNFSSSLADTLFLNVSEVYDDDSPTEYIKFKLNVISDKKSDDSYYFLPATIKNIYKMLFSKVGKYKIFVTADDGVLFTNSDTLNLEVLKLSQIMALNDEVKILSAPSIFLEEELEYKFPLFILGEDPNFKFEILNNKSIKNEKEKILDSILRINRIQPNKKNHRITLIKKSNSFSTNVEKISERLYSITLKGKAEYFDSSINIYGNSNGLKSNIENIKLKKIVFSPITFHSSVSYGYLDIKKNDTLKIQLSYRTVDFMKMVFRVAQKNFINKQLSASVGYISKRNDRYGIPFSNVKISGIIIDMGCGISKTELQNNLLVEYGVYFVAKYFPISFDSGGYFNHNNLPLRYALYGGEISLKIFPLRLKGWGVFVNVFSGTNNQNGLKLEAFNTRFGIAFTPLRQN